MTSVSKAFRALGFLPVACALLAPALARGAGKACNDCCQLPCVEAEIRYAVKMQQWYRSQAGIRNLTPEKYEAAERARADELSKERAKDVGRLPACAWNLPDPKTDTIAVRQWSAAGWSMTADGKGNVNYNFSMKTNTETCKLSEKQVSMYHEIAPCSAMADAAEKHERFHVTSCEARKGRKPTMAEVVKDEIDAYAVELKELEALRQALEKICDKGTCKQKDTGEVKRQLEKELEELKKQLARRGGRGK